MGRQQFHAILFGVAWTDALFGVPGCAARDGVAAELVSHQPAACLGLVAHDDCAPFADLGIQARAKLFYDRWDW